MGLREDYVPASWAKLCIIYSKGSSISSSKVRRVPFGVLLNAFFPVVFGLGAVLGGVLCLVVIFLAGFFIVVLAVVLVVGLVVLGVLVDFLDVFGVAGCFSDEFSEVSGLLERVCGMAGLGFAGLLVSLSDSAVSISTSSSSSSPLSSSLSSSVWCSAKRGDLLVGEEAFLRE